MEMVHNKDDVLLYYLYKCSKSQQFKTRKLLYYYVFPAIVLIAGLLNYNNNSNMAQLIICFIIGILAFIFLPKYLKSYYKKHYNNYIDKNLSAIIGKNEIFEIIDDKIINKNAISESKVNIAEIKQLIELKDHYIISINDSASQILKKNNESENIMNTIKGKNNLEIIRDIYWKW